MLSKDEEIHFITAAKKNNASFKPLYEDNYLAVIKFLSNRMEFLEDAEDLASEVFLSALENIGNYRITTVPFRYWLLRIARNMLYNVTKKKGIYRVVNFDFEDLSDEVEASPKNQLNVQNSLINCLNNLNQKDLELVEMRFFEKRSFKEIGLLLSLSENNAKVSTYRALDRLKKNMKS